MAGQDPLDRWLPKAAAPPPPPPPQARTAPQAPPPGPRQPIWNPANSLEQRYRRMLGYPETGMPDDPAGDRGMASLIAGDIKNNATAGILTALQGIDWVLEHGPTTAHEGIKDIGEGQTAKGVTKVAQGAGTTGMALAAPLLPAAVVAAPLATTVALGGGYASMEATKAAVEKIGKAQGWTDDQIAAVSEVASIPIGMASGKLLHMGGKAATAWHEGKIDKEVWKLIQRGAPNTRTVEITEKDLALGQPHIDKQLQGKERITGLWQWRDTADKAIKHIEGVIDRAITSFPGATITTDPMASAAARLSQSEQAPFLSEGMAYLNRIYPQMRGKIPLKQADNIRRELNALNEAFAKKNNYSRADARVADPEFAAREAAAEALREGIYGELTRRKIPNIDTLRLEEGAVIKLRDQAEHYAYAHDRAVGGTSKRGVVGGVINAASHIPVGPRWIRRGIAESLSPGNRTRDQLIEEAFRMRRGGAEPVYPNVPAAPAAAAAAGVRPVASHAAAPPVVPVRPMASHTNVPGVGVPVPVPPNVPGLGVPMPATPQGPRPMNVPGVGRPAPPPAGPLPLVPGVGVPAPAQVPPGAPPPNVPGVGRPAPPPAGPGPMVPGVGRPAPTPQELALQDLSAASQALGIPLDEGQAQSALALMLTRGVRADVAVKAVSGSTQNVPGVGRPAPPPRGPLPMVPGVGVPPPGAPAPPVPPMNVPGVGRPAPPPSGPLPMVPGVGVPAPPPAPPVPAPAPPAPDPLVPGVGRPVPASVPPPNVPGLGVPMPATPPATPQGPLPLVPGVGRPVPGPGTNVPGLGVPVPPLDIDGVRAVLRSAGENVATEPQIVAIAERLRRRGQSATDPDAFEAAYTEVLNTPPTAADMVTPKAKPSRGKKAAAVAGGATVAGLIGMSGEGLGESQYEADRRKLRESREGMTPVMRAATTGERINDRVRDIYAALRGGVGQITDPLGTTDFAGMEEAATNPEPQIAMGMPGPPGAKVGHLFAAPVERVGGRLLLSSRVPSAKGTLAATGGPLVTDLAALRQDPVLLKKFADRMRTDPMLTDRERGLSDAGVLQAIIDKSSQNISHLIGMMPEPIAKRAAEWYPGGHRIGNDFAKVTGVTGDQAAAVLASQSPSKEWNQNVNLGQRIMSMWKKWKGGGPVFTTEMARHHEQTTLASAEEWIKTKHLTGEDAAKTRARAAKKIADANANVGKPWAALPLKQQSRMMRAVSELEDPAQSYPVWSPEGTIAVPVAMNADGTPKRLVWQSYANVENALSVLHNGSDLNISQRVGKGHKVRSFFNNINVPDDPRSLTVDTHYVGGAHLRPMGGKAPEVKYVMAGPGSAATGIKGAHAVYRDAGMKAAEAHNLPRPSAGQSIAWEAIKGLFSPAQRRDKEFVAKVRGLWEEHRRGKMKLDNLYDRIEDLAGGFTPPEWFTPE